MGHRDEGSGERRRHSTLKGDAEPDRVTRCGDIVGSEAMHRRAHRVPLTR